MDRFKLVSTFQPQGDQPLAIKQLVDGKVTPQEVDQLARAAKDVTAKPPAAKKHP